MQISIRSLFLNNNVKYENNKCTFLRESNFAQAPFFIYFMPIDWNSTFRCNRSVRESTWCSPRFDDATVFPIPFKFTVFSIHSVLCTSEIIASISIQSNYIARLCIRRSATQIRQKNKNVRLSHIHLYDIHATSCSNSLQTGLSINWIFQVSKRHSFQWNCNALPIYFSVENSIRWKIFPTHRRFSPKSIFEQKSENEKFHYKTRIFHRNHIHFHINWVFAAWELFFLRMRCRFFL